MKWNEHNHNNCYWNCSLLLSFSMANILKVIAAQVVSENSLLSVLVWEQKGLLFHDRWPRERPLFRDRGRNVDVRVFNIILVTAIENFSARARARVWMCHQKRNYFFSSSLFENSHTIANAKVTAEIDKIDSKEWRIDSSGNVSSRAFHQKGLGLKRHRYRIVVDFQWHSL